MKSSQHYFQLYPLNFSDSSEEVQGLNKTQQTEKENEKFVFDTLYMLNSNFLMKQHEDSWNVDTLAFYSWPIEWPIRPHSLVFVAKIATVILSVANSQNW